VVLPKAIIAANNQIISRCSLDRVIASFQTATMKPVLLVFQTTRLFKNSPGKSFA
jgi:hypothetical protein